MVSPSPLSSWPTWQLGWLELSSTWAWSEALYLSPWISGEMSDQSTPSPTAALCPAPCFVSVNLWRYLVTKYQQLVRSVEILFFLFYPFERVLSFWRLNLSVPAPYCVSLWIHTAFNATLLKKGNECLNFIMIRSKEYSFLYCRYFIVNDNTKLLCN